MSIDKKFLEGIVKEIKENREKLGSCKKHDFVPSNKNKINGYTRYYECNNCGGYLESDSARWYMLGLEHGGVIDD